MSVLSEKLRLLATATGGIQKLRELILELAVRGRLAQQNSDDEPAEELLKRIARDRALLQVEGNCKQSKPVPTVDEGDRPFDVPETWRWIRFAQLAPEFQNGESSRGAVSGIETVVLRLADISNGEISMADTRSVILPESSISKYQLLKNDLLVVRVNGSTEIVGRFLLNDKNLDAIYCDHFIRIRVKESFLSHQFLRLIGDAPLIRRQVESSFVTTAGQKTVNQGHISNLILPLPPLAEQYRIVTTVSELMALCDRLEAEQADAEFAHSKLVEALLGTLTQSGDAQTFAENWNDIAEHFDTLFTTDSSIDALKQAILQLAVMGKLVPQNHEDEPAGELLKQISHERMRLANLGENKVPKRLPSISIEEATFAAPKGWEWVKLGTVVELINGDRSKNYPNREEYVSTGVPWINTGHIQPDGTLTQERMHFITRQKFNSLRSGKIKPDDLVYCLRGATFGKTAFVTPYSEGAIASSLVIMRPCLPALKDFLFIYLTSPFGRSQILRFDNGSAQPNLSANSVTLYALPIPPLAEQHRIVAKVNELMSLCSQLKADLTASRSCHEHLASTLVDLALMGP